MGDNVFPFWVHEGCGITTRRTIYIRNMGQLFPNFTKTVLNEKYDPCKNSDHLPKPELVGIDDVLGKFIPILNNVWNDRKIRKTR